MMCWPAIAACMVLMISCTDLEKSSLDRSLPVVKEKKDTHLVKAKKKERKKPAPITKRKNETPAAPGVTNEAETPAASGNASMMNVLAYKINDFAAKNGYSTRYCFLVDMSLPSGRKRFFVYDLENRSLVFSGLVAHGSCNETFLSRPKFSNSPNCGCSSLGKYKVGEFYTGKYGKSFKLYGLDNSNSNAYRRAVVIHGYDCVPDKEIYPMVLCNSLGCIMVSYNFFDKLSQVIRRSEKPIIMWVYQ